MAQLAGYALLVGVVTLVASFVALALFFGGRGDRWGPVNDVLIAITLFLMVPAVLEVRAVVAPSAGAWFELVSIAALVGIAVAGVGQLALVAGLISLNASFVTGGIGFALVVAWIGATAIAAMGVGELDESVGWWSVGVLAVIGVAAVGSAVVRGGGYRLTVLFGTPVTVVIAGWMVALAVDLLARG